MCVIDQTFFLTFSFISFLAAMQLQDLVERQLVDSARKSSGFRGVKKSYGRNG